MVEQVTKLKVKHEYSGGDYRTKFTKKNIRPSHLKVSEMI